LANLSSRLIISLTDQVSGPAKRISASLKQIHTRASAQPFRVMREEAGRAREHFRTLAAHTTAAAVGVYAFVEATKNFNESKFGYGMARLSDFTKNGKVDWAGWKADMDSTAKSARALAKQVGTTAEVAMQAREEVEKVGARGKTAESIWKAALGLHMSEPNALSSGDSVQFINALYNAYSKQREELAKKLHKDANDPKFQEAWINAITGKVIMAGNASPLGPANIVEGMRQFAPQWASMGIAPEFALAMLANGSQAGFGASELGTSFKSLASRIIKPTPAGLKALDSLGIDRSKYTSPVAQYPAKATTTLNSLLGGGLSKQQKAWITRQLKHAQEKGATSSPEFQQNLTNKIARWRGARTEADRDEIRTAVSNATLAPGGNIDLQGFIKELVDKHAGPAALMDIFEGKHYARNTPTFQFYEKLMQLFEQINAVGPDLVGNITDARKQTEAGTADQAAGAWQELLLKIQDTGAVEQAKAAFIGLGNAIEYAGGAALGILAALGIVVGSPKARGAVGRMAGFGRAAAEATAVGAEGAKGAKKLFSTQNQKANARAASDATKRMKEMHRSGGPNYRGRIAEGMSASGAAAERVAGKTAAKGAAKVGARFIPGIGWIIGLGLAGMDAYEGYQKDGLKGAILNPLTFGLYSSRAEGAEADAGAGAEAGAGQQQQAITIARQTADQIRGVFSGLNLTAEGQRLIESLAAGMRAGIPSVQSAASSAAAAAAGNALRGAYHDGAR
jgi:hypothetical protein